MSLSDLAEPRSSSSSSTSYRPSTSPPPSQINVTVPTSLLILPTTAALVGLSIGIVRGGGRARLRFLAENAHRQPKTIQGWYFYTKTRNYRVFFGAARTGAKYALGLGGATAAYVLLDESIGWSREHLFGYTPPPQSVSTLEADDGEEGSSKKRVGWRRGPVQWEDGALAGGIMGFVVGMTYRLPRQLFIRSVLMGLILGGSTSALQIAQDRVRQLKEEEDRRRAAESSSGANSASVPASPSNAAAATAAITEDVVSTDPTFTSTFGNTTNSVSQEDGVSKPTKLAGTAVDLIPLGEEEKTLWDKVKGFVGR
ncbi:hypothetical protein I317_03003 [Kwoniella heveanensis CBS 569]|uniref:Uncharacterized protein n=1 Tax=Kwoniella heveanensis BCC8398 TaxID=1296120 RepID=A0A1B9H091_9TREE|nr:hypothetical protein I316_01292 [Kwoniella heveanensis BCC8398]OCF43159.1 hypothetical protein I317_03003 [Kwoniella heveanensis CBS 569]